MWSCCKCSPYIQIKAFVDVFRKDAFFVDLFVRMSNNVAVDMYKQLGYVVYRRVLEYYSGDPDEDAYGEGFWHLKFFTTKNNKI